MSESSEANIIKRFRESIDEGTFPGDMKVVYRIAGGMPSQRLEEEFIISGNGKTEVRALDMLASKPEESASLNLNQADTREAFEKIKLSLDSMVPLEKTNFLPDSLVGSVTLEVGGEKITLYFPVEEEKREEDRKFVSSPMSDTIQYFRNTSKRLLEKGKGGNL
jgi:hypothetical protein